jgi:hypothetical protein
MRVLRAAGAVLALVLAPLGADAATSLVGPIQTYSCTNQVATALASGTAATTCSNVTAAMFGSAIGAGTLFGNPTGSAGAPSFTAAPVLGVASTTAGTLGLASSTQSGIVQLENTGATASWHLDFPATAGSSNGQVMTWQGVDTPMTWQSVALAAVPILVETTGPVTLTSALDRTVFYTTTAAVTFNLTGSVVAGDNWCFVQTSSNAWTLAANSVTGMTITVANSPGTATTGTLVSGAAGSLVCIDMITATNAQAYTSNGAVTNN